jgi:hypothetical protein
MYQFLFSLPVSRRLIQLSIAACILSAANASADDTLQAGIDSFFVQLSGMFDRIASNPAVKKKRRATVDGYFLSQLKRHQVIRSLTKTDTKGVCRTEMVRISGANHQKQDFKKEQWFKAIARGESEYHTTVKDTGRYYLVWSKPIMTSSSANPKMIGVIMMKIDLWDCFQEISQSTDKPFLVYLRKMRFYDHKWKKSYAFTDQSLAVPGVSAMTLRMQKETAPVPAPDTTPVIAQPAAEKPDSTPVVAAKKKLAVNAKIGILIGIAGAALLLIFIALFIHWIKNKMVIRAINKGM